jgi:Sel1 repeat
MESQQSQPGSHEYRMKVSKSGLYLLLAVLFIVASIPVVSRGLASTSVPMALGRMVVGAFLLFSGVFMVATAARSRLLIEESQIRFRIVFREAVFLVSEIEGFRTITTGPASHRVSRRVICVKGRREPIEIALFDPDEFLQTWLQQFPNLDQSDQPRSSESSFRKSESGFTTRKGLVTWRCSMRRRWVIVGITSMTLICAGIVVRIERKNRQLAKWAAVYRVRAERGDAKSQFALGAMYYYGNGVPKDYVEAVYWYRKSAEQGNADAQYSLSYMHHGGKGLPQDDSEAARWCRSAAEQGNALAQDALGIIYRRGEGVPPDDAEAVRRHTVSVVVPKLCRSARAEF